MSAIMNAQPVPMPSPQETAITQPGGNISAQIVTQSTPTSAQAATQNAQVSTHPGTGNVTHNTNGISGTPTTDLGEATVAAIGIMPFMIAELPRITLTVMDKIHGLEKRISKLARDMVRDELDMTKDPEPGYRELTDAIAHGWDESAEEEMIGLLPQEAQLPALTCAKAIVDFIGSEIPKSAQVSIIKTTSLQVSDVDWWKFLDLYQLACDPLYVFQLMYTGALLPSHVAAFHTMWPTMSVAIDAHIQNAVTNELAKSQAYELPLTVEFGVTTWFGQPIDAVPYQDAYVQQAALNASKPNPSQSAVDPLAKDAQSAAQSAAYGQLGK